ncbi:MAG TPA: hypothetical protein VF833_08020, partial [Gaiellaceae bacterium]
MQRHLAHRQRRACECCAGRGEEEEHGNEKRFHGDGDLLLRLPIPAFGLKGARPPLIEDPGLAEVAPVRKVGQGSGLSNLKNLFASSAYAAAIFQNLYSLSVLLHRVEKPR